MSKLYLKAAVDVGNDGVKAVSGDSHLWIPNLVAPEKERRGIIQMNQDPLGELHVRIRSGALPGGDGIYVVGQLAKDYPHAEQMDISSDKSKSVQPIILLLTALALHAVIHSPDTGPTITAEYALALGLPITEVKSGRKQCIIDALQKNSHQVTFLETPAYQGKTVQIMFRDVFCYAEGHAAYVDLLTDDFGRPRNEELADAKIALIDIGSITTDAAVVAPKGRLDNLNSESIKVGIAHALDTIAERVFKETGYRLKSRQHLVDIVTHPDPNKRNRLLGKGISIHGLVDQELCNLARTEIQFVRRLCDKVPDIELCYFLGGGSILLRSYLEHLNQGQLPMMFPGSVDQAIWMNARAYWKLLNMTLAARENG